MADPSEKTDQVPDWFTPDLYKYENTPEYWLEEIERRIMVRSCGKDADFATEFFLETIVRRDNDSFDFGYGELTKHWRWPVSNLSVLEAAYFTNLSLDDKSHQKSIELASMCAKDPLNAMQENSRDQIDEIMKSNPVKIIPGESSFVTNRRLPCSVDISLDDRTLKRAFKTWLESVRRAKGKIKKHKKPIGEKDFENWKENCVLPAFDLQYWKELGQIKLTDAAIGYLLWPDQDPSKQIDGVVDTTDRYRRTTKPLVRRVIHPQMNDRLRYQMTLEKWITKKNITNKIIDIFRP